MCFMAVLISSVYASAATRVPVTFAPGMTVVSSSHVAGAANVRLTISLQYEMQCGYAGAGALTVTFPSAVDLPKAFPTGSVVLAGKPTAAKISGHAVTVTVAPHKGMMCDVMGPGRLQLAFAPAAGLANPASPGSYRFKATHARRSFSAALAIAAS
jgi:hypothetical protein